MIRKRISLQQREGDIESASFLSTEKIAGLTQAERRGEHTPELLLQLGRQPAYEIVRVGFASNLDGRIPCHATDKHGDCHKRRERISIRAQKTWKEMDEKNTDLADGNNFLIQRRGRCSTPVRNRGPKACLALKWQPGGIKARFTYTDRRFPTPSPQWRNNREIRALLTTSHLLLAIHRRRATSLLPFSQPISHFADSHSQRAKRGAGGQARASGESASIEKRTRKFYSYWFPCPVLVALKKNALRTVVQFQAVSTRAFT
jgi:hypothetical protein